jgi:hypothetical protein
MRLRGRSDLPADIGCFNEAFVCDGLSLTYGAAHRDAGGGPGAGPAAAAGPRLASRRRPPRQHCRQVRGLLALVGRGGRVGVGGKKGGCGREGGRVWEGRRAGCGRGGEGGCGREGGLVSVRWKGQEARHSESRTRKDSGGLDKSGEDSEFESETMSENCSWQLALVSVSLGPESRPRLRRWPRCPHVGLLKQLLSPPPPSPPQAPPRPHRRRPSRRRRRRYAAVRRRARGLSEAAASPRRPARRPLETRREGAR